MQHLYDVTFQVGGEERVERVEAPDAASAVEAVRSSYRGTTDLFELIQVHMLDEGEGDAGKVLPDEAEADSAVPSR